MKLIPMQGPKSAGRWAIIDDEEYDELSKHEWHMDQNGAAASYLGAPLKSRQLKKMHRLILGTAGHIMITHVNGDHLDNRKSNLNIRGKKQNITVTNTPLGAQFIPLTKDKFALVDDDQFDFINQWNWTYGVGGYAHRGIVINGKSITILMHRVLNGTPDHMQTDHINGDTLDNRKKNLRTCTQQENTCNRRVRYHSVTGLKGVSKDKRLRRKPYSAAIGILGKRIFLGYFETPKLAHEAYKAAAKTHHGDFARTD